jgi:hypothetical protein
MKVPSVEVAPRHGPSKPSRDPSTHHVTASMYKWTYDRMIQVRHVRFSAPITKI